MQCNVVVADGRIITPAGVLQLFLRFRKFLLQQQKLRILRCIFFVFRFGKKEPNGVSQFVFGVLPLFYVRVDFRAPACPAAQFFRPLRFAGRRVGKRRKQPVAAFKPVQRFFPRFVGQGVEFCQLVVKKTQPTKSTIKTEAQPIYLLLVKPVGVFIIIMSGENTIFLSALSADLFAVETDVNFPVVKFAVSVDSFPLSAFIFKTVAQGNAGRSAV